MQLLRSLKVIPFVLSLGLALQQQEQHDEVPFLTSTPATIKTIRRSTGHTSITTPGKAQHRSDSTQRQGSSHSHNFSLRTLQEQGGQPLTCLESLIFADVNFDRKVDETEYITFLNLNSPDGFLPPDVDDFDDLPLVLKSNFLILACLCQQEPGADPNCCIGSNAHIRNNGAAPGETPTQEEQAYLSQVCFLTQTSIDKFLSTIQPTESPVISPTKQPIFPTPVPTTKSPTTTPTAFPTTSPTVPPTRSPTLRPTKGPTFPPTRQPTKAPTSAPTELPTTSSPTGVPTLAPVIIVTPSPTASPTVGGPPVITPSLPPSTPATSFPTIGTLEPTTSIPVTTEPTTGTTLPPGMAPTITPSTFPTDDTSPIPTMTPSVSPSLVQTLSVEPSSIPTEVPTSSPTITPMPTRLPDIVIETTYVIARLADATPPDYIPDLILAMNLLAPEVASNTTTPDNGAIASSEGDSTRKLSLRSLQQTADDTVVEVFLPTEILLGQSTNCPRFVDSDDVCEEITAEIGLFVDDTNNATAVAEAFRSNLDTSIQNGNLQLFLEQVNPNSPVYIVNFEDDDDADRVIPSDSDGLSGGGIAGIVAAGVAGILITGALLLRRGRDDNDVQPELKEHESVDPDELQSTSEINKAISTETPRISNVQTTMTTVPSPPASRLATDTAMYMGGAALAAGAVAAVANTKSKDDAHSDAGSSGWSSREGLSSLEEDSRASGPSTAGAAAVSISDSTDQDQYSIDRTDSSYSEDGLQLTYTELDTAIQKGDWAAVGVTAALLASQSYGNETNETGSDKKVNFQEDMNPDRAAELDRLVEAGDWAGVVAAAAKFDAQEARSDAGASSSGVSITSTRTGDSNFSGSGTAITDTASGAFTSGGGTSNSDSGSRARKLDEIRTEVEMLVDKVVPEEKDNIDEMLTQFRGREEELVETLRTMQEREVAQKARVEGQKRAKRDAKQTAEQNKQLVSLAVDNTGEPADESWIREIDDTPSEPDVPLIDTSDDDNLMDITRDEVEEQKEAVAEVHEEEEVTEGEPSQEDLQASLKRAIDSEDWEMVAKAAAGLSTRFATEGSDEDSSTKGTDDSQQINELVDRGDWSGVLAAASRFAENEKSVATGDDSTDIEERRARREQRLREEQEALEQADIWKAIADQTRQSSLAQEEQDANQAATVAADWAIARSLSELKAADKAGRLSDREDSDSDSSHDEV